MSSSRLRALPSALLLQAVVTAQTLHRPAETHDLANYANVVAGEHLQGYPATVKWGIVLHNPTFARADWPNFQSGLVCNNPKSPQSFGGSNPAQIKVDLFSPAGALLSSQGPTTVDAEGQLRIDATQFAPLSPFGFGVVAMTSSSPGVGGVAVGATSWPNPINPAILNRGDMRSWQQLQVQQRNTSVFMGPFSLLRAATRDEQSFSYGLGFAINPSSTANTVRVEVWADGSIRSTRTATIAPAGALLVDDVWNLQRGLYLNQIPLFLQGAYVKVISQSNLPLIGEFFYLDTTNSNNPGAVGVPRMASAMAAIAPARFPTCPEVTSEIVTVGQARVETMIALANISSTSSATVTIAYLDEDAVTQNTRTVVIPAASTTFVGPDTGNTAQQPRRWRANISTTSATLIGWTMRLGNFPLVNGSPSYTPHPMWGEALIGTNGVEPGIGFLSSLQEFILGTTPAYTKAHKTLALWAPNYDSAEDPGYCTLTYVGPTGVTSLYDYRYHTAAGILLPRLSPPPGNLYRNTNGLPNNFIAFTFEDPMFPIQQQAAHMSIVGAVTNTNDLQAFRWTGIWTSGPVGEELGLPNSPVLPGEYPGNKGGGGEH
jgi:hypothetical protein